MQHLLIIAVGAAVGANLRYLLGSWLSTRAGTQWPYGTLAVNLLGCLLIGMLFSWARQREGISDTLRLLLATGLLGGFTTFSSFGYETYSLLSGGRYLAAALYVGLSNLLGIAAVFLGAELMRRLA